MKQTRLFGGECMPSHRNRISYDTVKKSGLICGIIYAVIGFFVRLCVKNPYNMIHVLGADAYLPPLWLFNLLSLFWLFISGFAAGIVIGRHRYWQTCKRQNGGQRRDLRLPRTVVFYRSVFSFSYMVSAVFWWSEAGIVSACGSFVYRLLGGMRTCVEMCGNHSGTVYACKCGMEVLYFHDVSARHITKLNYFIYLYNAKTR